MTPSEYSVDVQCHCGAVRAYARLPLPLHEVELLSCNCSICTMKGIVHLILPRSALTLLSGEAELTTYTFGTHTAKHTFCRRCGICAFYYPRSHPEGVSINVRCIDGVDIDALTVVPFDGQNWEAARRALDDESKPGTPEAM